MITSDDLCHYSYSYSYVMCLNSYKMHHIEFLLTGKMQDITSEIGVTSFNKVCCALSQHFSSKNQFLSCYHAVLSKFQYSWRGFHV